MVWLWHLLFVLALLIQLASAVYCDASKRECKHFCRGALQWCSTAISDGPGYCCAQLKTGVLVAIIVGSCLVLLGIVGGIVGCCFCCAGCPIYKSRARKKNAAPPTQVTAGAPPPQPIATAPPTQPTTPAPPPQATISAPPPQANAKCPYPEEPTTKSGTQETTLKSGTQKTSTA